MNDERLRQAFEELRTSDAAHAPRFERLWQRRPVAPRQRSLAVAFVLTLLIGLVTAAVLHWHRRAAQPAISAWRAPTDFLLKTPGQELLRSIPDLKGKPQ